MFAFFEDLAELGLLGAFIGLIVLLALAAPAVGGG